MKKNRASITAALCLLTNLKLVAFYDPAIFVQQLETVKTTKKIVQGNSYLIITDRNGKYPATDEINNLDDISFFYLSLNIESDIRGGWIRVKFNDLDLSSALSPTLLSKGATGEETKAKYS